TGRELHRRKSSRRRLPKFAALQGQRRARGAATWRGPDDCALAREVRASRCAGIRCFRHSVSPPQSRGGASDHPGAAWEENAGPARAAWHSRTRLLGQRLPAHERQPAAAYAGGLSWTEAEDPVLEGPRAANARAWGYPAGDGFLRGIPSPANRSR